MKNTCKNECNIVRKETILDETAYNFYCTSCQKVFGLPIPANFKETMPSPPSKRLINYFSLGEAVEVGFLKEGV